MSQSLYRKVGLASAIMMASVFLSRLTGLLREMVIAYIGGATAEVDAYLVAFIIPEILNHILASGFLSVTFIPIFSRYLVVGREPEGWRVFSSVLTVFGTLLIGLVVAAFVLAPQLVVWLAPGRDDPLFRANAVYMTRIIIPAQLFFFSGGLFMAVQFAKERFLLPALAPLIYNVGIITGGLLLGRWLGMAGFAWGVLSGAFIGTFALQLWGARRAGMVLTPRFDWRHPDLRKYLWLSLPLMFGLTMTFSTEFFIKFFGSFLPQGQIAGLNYAQRVMLLLVAFFGQAAGTASFPFLARLAAEGKIESLNNLLDTTLRYLALVIPLAVLVMVLRRETVVILFQRGRFDMAATAVTSQALAYMMIGAGAFAAMTVVVRGFYAMQNTLFPAVFSTLAVLASIPLYLFGMHQMGVGGVALASSLAAVMQTTLLYVLWNRKSGNAGGRAVGGAYLKAALLSVPLGLALEWLRRMLAAGIETGAFGGSLAVAAIVGAVFAAILLGAGYLLRIEEITGSVARLRRRLSGSGPE